jgi:hypothetical protein
MFQYEKGANTILLEVFAASTQISLNEETIPVVSAEIPLFKIPYDQLNKQNVILHNKKNVLRGHSAAGSALHQFRHTSEVTLSFFLEYLPPRMRQRKTQIGK